MPVCLCHLAAAFEDVTPEVALAFASTGIGFEVSGAPLAEDSALFDAGLDLNLSPTASLGVSYSGQIAHDLTDNAVAASPGCSKSAGLPFALAWSRKSFTIG